ncbi:MAG: hypothetical protein ACFFG0_02710 [Candidatus Thorarchaeota archaeon]
MITTIKKIKYKETKHNVLLTLCHLRHVKVGSPACFSCSRNVTLETQINDEDNYIFCKREYAR